MNLLERAIRADLIRFPEDIEGAVCANCEFVSGDFCHHPKVDQELIYGAENQCCSFWNAPNTLRGLDVVDESKEDKMVTKNNYSSELSPDEHKKDFEKLTSEEQNESIMNPGHVDEGLWDKAKKISMESYKELRWPFIMYMYKQLGGK